MSAQANSGPAKTGTLAGRVVYATNGTAIQAAELTLRSVFHRDDGQEYTTESLDNGSFVFKNVKAGRYYLRAEKQGFASGGSSVTRQVTVTADKEASIGIFLHKTSSISGRVLSKEEQPIAGTRVGAWTSADGDFQFKGETVTDNTGLYQLDNLRAGTYLIGLILTHLPLMLGSAPQPPEGGTLIRARTLYPNVSTMADAIRMRLSDEQDMVNVDLTARVVQGYCVTATRAPTPISPDAMTVVSVSERGTRTTLAIGTGVLPPSAKLFHFCGLEPGDYIVSETVASAERESSWSGMQSLIIDRSNVVLGALPLNSAQPLEGAVSIDQQQMLQQQPQSAKVWLNPVDRLPFADEDVFGVPIVSGKVFFHRLYPGEYRVRVSDLSPGYYVSQISAGGRDGLHEPIESQVRDLKIIMRSDGPSLAGSVSSDDPEADGAAVVVLVSRDDSGAAVFESQRTDQNGSFKFVSGFPPGTYKIIALTGLGPDEGRDLAVVSRFLAQATDIELKASSSETIQLKSIKAVL